MFGLNVGDGGRGFGVERAEQASAIPKRPEVMRITVRSGETRFLLNISVQGEEGQENKDEASIERDEEGTSDFEHLTLNDLAGSEEVG